MENGCRSSRPSQEAVASVRKHCIAMTETFPEAGVNFQRKWSAWHDMCLAQEEGATWISVATCVAMDEFQILKRLGPKIIPFVVFKLAQDEYNEHCYGVLLCKRRFSFGRTSSSTRSN